MMERGIQESLREVVTLFNQNIDRYKQASYDEANTRVDFIDKFFEILGWDVRNTLGYSEDYRDVVREDKVIIAGKPKAPDYSFRIGGVRKFFVEAKKPGVNIKDDREPALQVRRYAYTARLPLSILTDFEEFAVYDTRIKPNQHDKPSTGRVFYCTYKEYEKEFDFIASTFSKEAILKGSFDRYVQENKYKKGTSEVDKEFLKLIETWRSEIARNIALRNLDLSVYDLNYAVQKIIDRIIFLRIAEDRGTGEYGLLRLVFKGRECYGHLVHLFHKADAKYNSGLFREEPWLSDLQLDDRVLRPVIENLYYPQCPYEFSVLPIEILGDIYECFLGKTIRLTASHQAKIEEKPEVRKAGGVYYTPQYIVDYIVEHTVGEKISHKKPAEIEIIKILDPACGSGSFLVGAYSYLLDYHLSFYSDEKNHKKALKEGNIYQISENTYRLSTEEKQKILVNSIFGVDIDSQAVEVTKLSLLLKLMEDEQLEAREQLFKHSDLKLLPNLSSNIRCGNSLVGSDFYDNKNLTLFGGDEMRKINTFDWKKEFSDIFYSGKEEDRFGFDVVLGNPPYVRQELLGEYKEYFEKTYRVYHGVADLYVYFFERGLSLLSKEGIFGIIVANKWMRTNYGKNLRRFLKEKVIVKIIDFGDLPVFQDATTYPSIIIVNNGKPNTTFHAVKVDSLHFGSLNDYVAERRFPVNSKLLSDDGGWTLLNERSQRLLVKLKTSGIPLCEYVQGKIYRGVLTGFNEAFVIDETTKEYFISKDPQSAELIKPFLAGRDIKRYVKPIAKQYLIFTQRGVDIAKYPAIKKYLEQFKEKLRPKPKGWKGEKWKGRKPGSYKWYEIQDTIAYYQEFEKPKIIYPNICKRNIFTVDTDFLYTNQKCFIIPEGTKYLLGVLNSKTIFFLFKEILPKLRGEFYEPSYIFMKDFPIPGEPQGKKNKTEFIELRNTIENLVSEMLKTQEAYYKARTETDKKLLKQKIDLLDGQIDASVYRHYDLAEEEIEIIEESVPDG